MQEYLNESLLRPLPINKLSSSCQFKLITAKDLDNKAVAVLSFDWDAPRNLIIRNTLLKILRPTKLLNDALIPTKDVKPLDGIRAISELGKSGVKFTIFARFDVALSNRHKLMQLTSQGHDVFPHPDPSMSLNRLCLMMNYFKTNFGPIKAMRYHTISFPQGLSNAYKLISKFNIKISSNIGFNNAVGFPGGLAYGIKFTDFDLIEIPIIFMDLVPYREGYSQEETRELLEKLIQELAKNNGISSLIFHVDYLHDVEFYSLLKFLFKICEYHGVTLMNFGELHKKLTLKGFL
ncbi:MAG: hypothetical protein ABR909_05720 [Candidatus Bathyarchaeia archaeon]